MKYDTPLKLIQFYFMLKIVLLIVGVFLYFFNIPHPSFFNFLFEDSSLYNYSIIIPLIILSGYIFVYNGFKTRSNLARMIAIALSVINLFSFPIGTIISILIIIYLIFFEGDTFEKMKFQNLPYRVTGVGLLSIAIIGLLMITGIFTFFVDETLGYGYPSLNANEKINVDDTSGDVDVIIQLKGYGTQSLSTQNMIVADIKDRGGSVDASTNLIGSYVVANIDYDDIDDIASNSNVIRIVEDKKIFEISDFDKVEKKIIKLLDNSYSLVNAEPLWDEGITGDGIVVAVVDTGINADIPALQRDGKSVVISEYELYGDYTHSHGTLCASCIASQNSDYRGIAPGVDILDIGVFDGGSAYTSDIIQGWEYVAQFKQDTGRFVIVSNSFGGPAYADMGIISDAANKMVNVYNIPMICAAGNSGPNPGTVNTPAVAKDVLAVGAIDDDFVITSFSSRGPGSIVDRKPDVVAPGLQINMFDETGSVVVYSGTSFSTPITAGCMALVAQGHENYDAKQFNNAFKRGAMDLGGSGYDYDYGYGLVDVDKTYDMIENEIPEPNYMFIFSGIGILGLVVTGYPEIKKGWF